MSGATRTCTVCGETLPSELSCTALFVQLAGYDYPVTPNLDTPCPECGTTAGGHHHGACPLERCPRCGGHLVDCGCAGRSSAPAKEVFQWTIDEHAVASLDDTDAAASIDGMVDGLVGKIEAAASRAGVSCDVAAIRYEVARTLVIELIRKLAMTTATMMTESPDPWSEAEEAPVTSAPSPSTTSS